MTTAAVFPFELMDNPAFKGRIDRIGAFVALLQQAKGGQIVSSFRKIADTIGWTLEAVRQFIAALVAHTLINTATTHQGTTITICNYSDYCLPEIDSNTRTTQSATHQTDDPYIEPVRADAVAQGVNHTFKKESKKEGRKEEREDQGVCATGNAASASAAAPRNVIPIRSASDQSQTSAPRASRLPSDWIMPPEYGNWAMREGMKKSEIVKEADKFRDYWTAKAGKDARKASWEATWRNWIRRAIEMKGRPGYGRPAEKSDVGIAVFTELCGNPFDTTDEQAFAGAYQRYDESGLF